MEGLVCIGFQQQPMQQVPLLHRFSIQPMQHGGCVQTTNHDILHQLLVTTDAKRTFLHWFQN